MHGIAVRATDAAGNIDATPATQSFTVAAAAAPQTLIGDSSVQSTPDSNRAGTAEAFRATASASGTTAKMSVYVAPATPPARWWSASTATPTATPGRC